MLSLRRATLLDQRHLFEWRNHETIRRHSHSAEPIGWEAHCQWLAVVLQNPAQVLLIGEIESEPVGVLRYDCNEDAALVSIYLLPARLGQGLGAPLLLAGTAWLQQNHPSINTIVADIQPDNAASIRVFEKAGYVRHSGASGESVFRYRYDI